MAIFRSMANSVEQNTKPSISSSGAGFSLGRLGQATRHVITVMLFGGASGQGPSQRVGGIKRKRVVWRLFQSKRKKLAAPPQATNVSTCAAAKPLTCGAPMGFAHAALLHGVCKTYVTVNIRVYASIVVCTKEIASKGYSIVRQRALQ